ncbi:amino acid adenylation domain-containing protein [Flavicella sediminum]|uniref:amino acid adenylation domain-containing protein n=1 Tax=Flavicella sediminum TaxID=2585141 RepID=UPI001122FA61|nr:amino acid adenylation domain-containing protein [Flavicella sediminum]
MEYLLHALFEKQARLHPNNLAVKINNTTISYQELNLQANQFANYLIHQGIKQGDVVKICLERSIEMFIGILGILKCGAAYLPIDTDTPKHRLDLLFKDAPNPFLVSNTACYNSLHRITVPHKIISLGNLSNSFSNYPTTKPELNINKNTTAVILYTSGSTGTPKGVVLSHAALTNNILWHKDTYKHSEQDIVLQHASFTFDFSILEIFMALACGGLLVLARQKFHYDGFYLIELIKKEKITIIGSAPSLVRAYIKFPEFRNCISLKKVFLGGEALDRNLVNDFFKQSTAELINIYGPTECSISVLQWRCDPKNTKMPVPIGIPIANMKIILLDENQQIVKNGEIGEVHISGPGLGTKYLNRPDLTNEKFITNSIHSKLLYKTGDLAKKSKDGVYYFHGRTDHQVKISGQRVELGEIEFVLSSHKSISNCKITSYKINDKDLKIIAYVIPNKTLDLDRLNTYLSKSMPKYMLPNAYIEVEKFELSSNGKIDLTKLPKPDKNRIYTGISYKSPQNETQKKLSQIWEEILKMKPIGIKDPYHFLGGDSLGNILIHQLIETRIGHKIALDTFLKTNTIEAQAKIIDNLTISKKKLKVIFLRKKGTKSPIIITQTIHSEGIIFPNKIINDLPKDHPIIATIPFGLCPKKLPNSIAEAAKIYTKDLELISDSQEFILIGYSMGGLLASEMAHLLENKGKRIKYIYLLDSFHPTALINLINKNSYFNRILFYKKRIIQGNLKENILLVKYFTYFTYTRIKKLSTKRGQLSFMLRPLVLLGLVTKTEKLCKTFGNNNFLFAVNHQPKKITGQIILIVASDPNHSYNFKTPNSSLEENLFYLSKDISSEIKHYKVPFTHSSMLESSNLKTVTNIINEHLATS